MASSLSTGSNSGSQTATQTPQSAGSANTTAVGSSVQPGTTASLLNSDKGSVTLQNKSVTTVNIAPRQSQVSQFSPPPQKHTNPALFGISGLLFVCAITLFWYTARSADKSTTS